MFEVNKDLEYEGFNCTDVREENTPFNPSNRVENLIRQRRGFHYFTWRPKAVFENVLRSMFAANESQIFLNQCFNPLALDLDTWRIVIIVSMTAISLHASDRPRCWSKRCCIDFAAYCGREAWRCSQVLVGGVESKVVAKYYERKDGAWRRTARCRLGWEAS